MHTWKKLACGCVVHERTGECCIVKRESPHTSVALNKYYVVGISNTTMDVAGEGPRDYVLHTHVIRSPYTQKRQHKGGERGGRWDQRELARRVAAR